MTEKMKTICIGRLQVDVPAEAEIRVTNEMIGGFEIETVDESEAEFQKRIASRQFDIETRGQATDGTGGMIVARELRANGIVGRIFAYGLNRGYVMHGDRRVENEFMTVEAHARLKDLSFIMSAKYADEKKVMLAEGLLSRLQLRHADEIPTVQGFCIEKAVFADPLPPHKNENITMFVGLPSHPDLGMVLFSIANVTPGPGLLARTADIDAAAGADEILRTTKLRSDKRNINGMVGEELAERFREINLSTGYMFNWETRGMPGDLLQPYLSLEMQTGANGRAGGEPVDSTLHGDAVLALWDTVSSTLKPRKPTSPSPDPAPAPDGPKLGTIVRAGDICPQSGWWECSVGGDGLRVHGGQVQFLRKGDRIPQALLLPQQTLWQKVRGVQPSIEPDQLTVWQLVDKRSRARVTPSVPLAPAGMGAADLDVRHGNGPGVLIGSYIRTGDPCPASGWWRCEESHALDGTRWFAAGSLLPAATFRVPQGVFGKSAGPEVIQRRSAWQLVRHAEAPVIAKHLAAPTGQALNEPPSLA
jgi:hypothetical protein